MRFHQHVFLALLCALVIPGAAKSQTLVQTAVLNFGTVDFDASHTAWMYLGTDGNITVDGSGIVSYNDGHAGILTITAPTTGIVEIKCQPGADLQDSNGTNLDASQGEIALNTGVAFGNGASCNGISGSKSPALVVDLGATPTPNILLGARLKLRGTSVIGASGVYTTDNTTNEFKFRVLFQ